MIDKNIGFIGLGNLGENLANSILLGGFNLFIYDLIKNKGNNLIKNGAQWCDNIKSLVDSGGNVDIPNHSCIKLIIPDATTSTENHFITFTR